jgi:hypothetical protein
MISEERTCNKCGHRCHCYAPNCKECVNDVCGTCDCKEPDRTGTDARNWDGYLK